MGQVVDFERAKMRHQLLVLAREALDARPAHLAPLAVDAMEYALATADLDDELCAEVMERVERLAEQRYLGLPLTG